MPPRSEVSSIFIGREIHGARVYISQPGPDRTTWTAYDLSAGGELTNPQIVRGGYPASWRGLPILP